MPFPTPHITNIKLLAGVPLDATYRHSIYFASAGAQQSYFLGKVVSGLAWNDCMYHREHNAIRVDAPIESCEGVNYAMFQNSAYGTKWFYAFVTDHEYVNANCTELKIQQDVLQTWYFDYDLKKCFIERTHTTTDHIGDNIVPEPLEYGEYVIYNAADLIQAQVWDVYAWTTFSATNYGNPAGGDISTGIYSALDKTLIGRVNIAGGFDSPSWIGDPRNVIRDLISNHADKVDGLVAITMSPSITTPVSQPFTLRATNIDGYTPRNKKLFTSPYNVIGLATSDGTINLLRPEYFGLNVNPPTRWNNGDTVNFYVNSDKNINETITVCPENYRIHGSSLLAAEKRMANYVTLSGFPQCAWVSDAFKTFLAQNASNNALTVALGAGKIAAGLLGTAATEGVGAAVTGGLIVSGATDIAKVLGTQLGLDDHARMAPVSHGNITGTASMAISAKTVMAYNMCIHQDYAKRIDDYFDMFGYAINALGTVKLNARPHWTYIKTRAAVAMPAASSGCPAAALSEIQSIFDRGVTFWINGSEVGDYSLNNTV